MRAPQTRSTPRLFSNSLGEIVTPSAASCLNRFERFAGCRLVRRHLQRRAQMRYRFVVSAKLRQEHAEIAMDRGLLRIECERFLILADRFTVTARRFLGNWES